MATIVTCTLCNASAKGVVVAKSWCCWTVGKSFAQRPHGQQHLALVEVPAGTLYVLCDRCSSLLCAKKTAELSRIMATARGPIPPRVYGQIIKETSLFLSKLAEAASCVRLEEWVAANA